MKHGNLERAERAEKMLAEYAPDYAKRGGKFFDLDTALADTLADLMHFADANHLDFAEALERAENYHATDDEDEGLDPEEEIAGS